MTSRFYPGLHLASIGLLVATQFSCGMQTAAESHSIESGIESKNPLDGMSIRVYMPRAAAIAIDMQALAEVSRNLRFGSVSFSSEAPAQLGYNATTNTLQLQFDLKDEQVSDPQGRGYLLGYSDPLHISHFWVSLPQLEISYLKYISTHQTNAQLKTKEQYMTNAFSFTIAHEIFNHEIGIAVMTRPFQLDMYDERGTLNSADSRDVWENTARNLCYDSAYLSWKRRKGYP